MNTAQVSIELVLSGILALCAFVLPFFPDADLNSDLLTNEALVGVLGLAYLLGVIFDKLADAMLQPAEHLLRLQQADEYLGDHPDFKRESHQPGRGCDSYCRAGFGADAARGRGIILLSRTLSPGQRS